MQIYMPTVTTATKFLRLVFFIMLGFCCPHLIFELAIIIVNINPRRIKLRGPAIVTAAVT
jgi:hypothetical protein